MQRRVMTALLLAGSVLAGTYTSGALAAPVGLTSTPYTATYTDVVYGPVTCSGEHQTAQQFPGNETTGGRDVWRCTSTTGAPLTEAVPGQTVRKNVGSDYFYFVKGIEVIGTAKEHIAKNGLSYKAVAYWPWP